MRNKKMVIYSFLAMLLTFTFFHYPGKAQEAVITAGINVTGNYGSLSYSVGQVVYQFHTVDNISVVEGLQQPYRILAASATKEAMVKYLSFTIFPNPATDFVILKVENFNHEILSFQVVNIYGRVLHQQKITASQTSISLDNLAPAIYCVHVMLEKKLVNTFKIVKN